MTNFDTLFFDATEEDERWLKQPSRLQKIGTRLRCIVCHSPTQWFDLDMQVPVCSTGCVSMARTELED